MTDATIDNTVPNGIFPFEISTATRYGHPWFFEWRKENHEFLVEKYGSSSFTGEGKSKRSFSYYEVSLLVESMTTGVASFYWMASNVSGGRGALICEVPYTLTTAQADDDALRKTVRHEMLMLAVIEYERRERERLDNLRQQGILNVHLEMFGNWKP